MSEAGEEARRQSPLSPSSRIASPPHFSRLALIEQEERAEYSLDWAVLASIGLVKTPRPMSERAARENLYSVSGFRPSTAYDPVGIKVT